MNSFLEGDTVDSFPTVNDSGQAAGTGIILNGVALAINHAMEIVAQLRAAA